MRPAIKNQNDWRETWWPQVAMHHNCHLFSSFFLNNVYHIGSRRLLMREGVRRLWMCTWTLVEVVVATCDIYFNIL